MTTIRRFPNYTQVVARPSAASGDAYLLDGQEDYLQAVTLNGPYVYSAQSADWEPSGMLYPDTEVQMIELGWGNPEDDDWRAAWLEDDSIRGAVDAYASADAAEEAFGEQLHRLQRKRWTLNISGPGAGMWQARLEMGSRWDAHRELLEDL